MSAGRAGSKVTRCVPPALYSILIKHITATITIAITTAIPIPITITNPDTSIISAVATLAYDRGLIQTVYGLIQDKADTSRLANNVDRAHTSSTSSSTGYWA